MRLMRTMVPLVSVALASLVLPGTATAVPGGAEASGIVVLSADTPVQTAPPASALRALHAAWELSESNPDDFGYPWVDSSGQVVLDSVATTGSRLAYSPQTTAAGTRPRLRTVRYSFRELERIKHDAIGDTGGQLPGGEAIYETAPDPAHNRIVVTVERVTPALLNGLKTRYGTTAVAVRYQPDRPHIEPGSRDADTSPFFGGSRIGTPVGTCTSGFPWTVGGSSAMLTAGHCVPNGGNVGTSAQAMGTVTAGSGENYNTGVGSVLLPGSSIFRGDLALVNIPAGTSSVGLIYNGGPGTASSVAVAGMASELTTVGEKYCFSGIMSGQSCDWVVNLVRSDIKYSNGEVVRNVSQGGRSGPCAIKGDSGSPVYSYGSDGRVTARGIFSGLGTGGWRVPCVTIFTDIWDAYHGLPGSLAVSS